MKQIEQIHTDIFEFLQRLKENEVEQDEVIERIEGWESQLKEIVNDGYYAYETLVEQITLEL